ncbi:MAG: hypothetical protein ACO3PR_00045 [Limisphaerales bacterium]
MDNNPDKTIIVAIGPPLGGKSTFCQNLPGRFVVESFASPLYEMLGTVIGKNKVRELRRMNEKGNPCEELCGETLRRALQTLGTEWGRELMGEDIWLDHLLRRSADFSKIAVDDMRFPNEYEGLRKQGAIFVRLLPHKTLRKEGKGGWKGHQSEAHWKTFKVHDVIEWDERVEIMNAAQKFSFEAYRGTEPKL